MAEQMVPGPRRGKKDRGSSRSSKAGLSISIARVETELRKNVTTSRVSDLASVALAAVVEYVIKEIVNLAKAEMAANNRKRIMRRDLVAIGDDSELRLLVPLSSLGGIPIRKEVGGGGGGEEEVPKRKKKKSSRKKRKSSSTHKRKREEDEEESYSSSSSSSSSASPRRKKKARRSVRKGGKSPRKKK